MKRPKWTVHYNIVSSENNTWIGTGWEFFDKEIDGWECYNRHLDIGNVPTMRLYSEKEDFQHLGASHRIENNNERIAIHI